MWFAFFMCVRVAGAMVSDPRTEMAAQAGLAEQWRAAQLFRASTDGWSVEWTELADPVSLAPAIAELQERVARYPDHSSRRELANAEAEARLAGDPARHRYTQLDGRWYLEARRSESLTRMAFGRDVRWWAMAPTKVHVAGGDQKLPAGIDPMKSTGLAPLALAVFSGPMCMVDLDGQVPPRLPVVLRTDGRWVASKSGQGAKMVIEGGWSPDGRVPLADYIRVNWDQGRATPMERRFADWAYHEKLGMWLAGEVRLSPGTTDATIWRLGAVEPQSRDEFEQLIAVPVARRGDGASDPGVNIVDLRDLEAVEAEEAAAGGRTRAGGGTGVFGWLGGTWMIGTVAGLVAISAMACWWWLRKRTVSG